MSRESWAVYLLLPLASDPMPPGVERPEPSIEHTLRRCEGCGRTGWIGPGQLMRLTFQGGMALCGPCIAQADGIDTAHPHGMDREAEHKPRRRST